MAGRGETWTTIESDPGVFTELVQEMGVKGVQLEELYSLDDMCLEQFKPIYGLIFLFKWRHEKDDRPVERSCGGKVFFASQVINNACATQAILSVLLNCPDIDLGTELGQFKEFTAEFPPELKGLAISNSDSIRRAHNSFARPEPIISDESHPAGKDDDVFHFISYVPVEGTLYELDGLKEGPIALCPCTEDDWLSLVSPHIQSRIERYARDEIRFNLMALCRDKREVLTRQIATKQRMCQQLEECLALGSAASMTTGDDPELPSDPHQQRALLDQLHGEIASLQDALQQEHQKRANWRDENIRRKHNYIPFLFNFLKILAEKKMLVPLVDEAMAKAAEKGHASSKEM